MKETADIKEFCKVLKEDFKNLTIFDFIRLIKISKKYNNLKKRVGSDDELSAFEAKISKSINGILGVDVRMHFDASSDASYGLQLELPSKRSNLASGKFWGIPTGN